MSNVQGKLKLPDLVDTDAFKAAMGAVATPVSVVTAYGDAPHGTTVSAFMSLSLEPTMVVISLQDGSELLDILRRTRRFGINVLAHDQAAVAAQFARRGIDRWQAIDWELVGGVPRIAGHSSFVVCRVSQAITAGDHVLLTGLVTHAESTHQPGLSYQHRRFGTFTAHA